MFNDHTYPYVVSFVTDREGELGTYYILEILIHGQVTVTEDEFIPHVISALDDRDGDFVSSKADLTWVEYETAESHLIEAARSEFGDAPKKKPKAKA